MGLSSSLVTRLSPRRERGVACVAQPCLTSPLEAGTEAFGLHARRPPTIHSLGLARGREAIELTVRADQDTAMAAALDWNGRARPHWRWRYWVRGGGRVGGEVWER